MKNKSTPLEWAILISLSFSLIIGFLPKETGEMVLHYAVVTVAGGLLFGLLILIVFTVFAFLFPSRS